MPLVARGHLPGLCRAVPQSFLKSTGKRGDVESKMTLLWVEFHVRQARTTRLCQSPTVSEDILTSVGESGWGSPVLTSALRAMGELSKVGESSLASGLQRVLCRLPVGGVGGDCALAPARQGRGFQPSSVRASPVAVRGHWLGLLV